MTQGGRMNAGGQKKEVSVSSSDVSIEGIGSEFLIISKPCKYSSVSTRKDWGMMVPAFMVPNNRVSPYVEDQAANEKSASRRKSPVLRRGFRSFRANLIRR
jgi:hypothetical protein